jgi:hypothetical protein
MCRSPILVGCLPWPGRPERTRAQRQGLAADQLHQVHQEDLRDDDDKKGDSNRKPGLSQLGVSLSGAVGSPSCDGTASGPALATGRDSGALGRHGPGSVLHLNACPRFRYGGHVRDRVADGAGSLRAERGRWRSSRRTGRELDGAVTGRPSLPRVRCSCESARAGLRVGGAGGGRCGIPVSGWSLASTPAAP